MIGQEGANAPNSAGAVALVEGHSSHGSNSYTLLAARRLLGMDESDDEILRILASAPRLVVEDFADDKLGFVGLSFNLSPALVARVAAWTRSCWDVTV